MGRSATCEDGQGGDPELTTTIRKSVIINEFESDKFNPNDTILTMTPTESSRKARMWTDSQLETGTKDLDRTLSGAGYRA